MARGIECFYAHHGLLVLCFTFPELVHSQQCQILLAGYSNRDGSQIVSMVDGAVQVS